MCANKLSVVEVPSSVESGWISDDDLIQALYAYKNAVGEWNAVLAIYTDKVLWFKPEELQQDSFGNLLELRAYNEMSELRALRDTLGTDFAWRLVVDGEADKEGDAYDAHFDESQYLDIDSHKSHGNDYVATGGGAYRLPIRNAKMIQVRNYINYGVDDGMARVVDFRIVGLLGGDANV